MTFITTEDILGLKNSKGSIETLFIQLIQEVFISVVYLPKCACDDQQETLQYSLPVEQHRLPSPLLIAR